MTNPPPPPDIATRRQQLTDMIASHRFSGQTSQERAFLTSVVTGDLGGIHRFCDAVAGRELVRKHYPCSFSDGHVSILELGIDFAIRADQGPCLDLLFDKTGISTEQPIWRYDRLREDNAVLEKSHYIHAAASLGDVSCLRVLLDHGADLYARAFDAFTAVCYAKKNPHIIKMLEDEPKRREEKKRAQEREQQRRAQMERLERLDRIAPRIRRPGNKPKPT